jgi:hypothetical protein
MREFTSEPAPEDEEAGGRTLPRITITLDGEKFSTCEEMDADGLLAWSQLADAAAEGAEAEEAASYTHRFLRAAFGPEEYKRFRLHLRAHHTPVSTLMKVVAALNEEMEGLAEAETGRPTVPSSPSSPGDEGLDERTRKVISLQQGTVQLVPAPQDHKPKQRKKASAG